MSTAVIDTEQFLSFYLNQDIYAFEIRNVKEIIDVIHITRVPRMPECMLGAINLRGEVVPVLDLCIRFGLPENRQTIDTCIIIVETLQLGKATKLGLMVGAINEVLIFEKDKIEPPPRIGMNISTEFIKGIGQNGNEFVTLLDIDRLLVEEN